MNIAMNDLMKRVTLPIMIGLGFLVVNAPAAEAHKIDNRSRVTQGFYFDYDRGYAVPRWVRKDREFRQWFLHSRYRYARRQNWHGLYDLYLYDRKKYRRAHSYYRSGKKYRNHDAPPRRNRH